MESNSNISLDLRKDKEDNQEKTTAKTLNHPKFISIPNTRNQNLVQCYPCKVEDCLQLFNSYKELVEHKNTHLNLYRCEAKNCDKTFIEKANLKRHYKLHFPTVKKYKCTYPGCNKSYTATNNLTIHYRIHIGSKPYTCQKCGKGFFDKANYNYHYAKHINTNRENLSCCHKNCSYKSKTQKQKLMHHEKLEKFCVQEKNKLINLIVFFQKSILSLLKNKNIDGTHQEDLNLTDEIKKLVLDKELKSDFEDILKCTKYVNNKALNQDQYYYLVEKTDT